MRLGEPQNVQVQIARAEPPDPRRAGRSQLADRDDEDERAPQRKRKIHGLIPLLIILPVCVMLLILAPFYKEAARFSALTGLVLMIVAIAVAYQSFNKKGFEKDMADTPLYMRRIMMVVLQIMYAFRYPRLLACWVILQYFAMIMMIVGGIIFESVNWYAREHPYVPPAPRQVVSVTGDSRLDKLLSDLEEPGKSQAAGDQLAALKPDEHRPKVAAKLAALTAPQTNNFVRKAAIKALGKWATPKEVPDLIRCLEDFGSRSEAAEALRALEPESRPTAEDQLLPLLKRRSGPDSDSCRAAIGVLKDIGTDRSVPDLEDVAKTAMGYLAQPAREALAAIAARKR
jgi:hypothetical protein